MIALIRIGIALVVLKIAFAVVRRRPVDNVDNGEN